MFERKLQTTSGHTLSSALWCPTLATFHFNSESGQAEQILFKESCEDAHNSGFNSEVMGFLKSYDLGNLELTSRILLKKIPIVSSSLRRTHKKKLLELDGRATYSEWHLGPPLFSFPVIVFRTDRRFLITIELSCFPLVVKPLTLSI